MMDASRPWILARAAASPHAAALRVGGACFDFASLAAGARDLAQALRSAGVGEGDVIAALVGNDLGAVLLAHATPLCGAVLLPLNSRLSAPEIAFQLRDAGAKMLLHGEGELAAKARAAAPQALVRVSLDPRGRLRRETGAAEHGARPLRDRLDLEQPFAILYTSGTTGQPKGVVLTHANFLASAEASARLLGARPDDDWLAALPLFHVGGLSILTRSVLMGTRVTVQPRFDPDEMSRALDEGDITMVSLVSAMLRRLLDVRLESPAPPQLRCVLLGGGPTPHALLERALRLGFPVAPTYGLTEATSQVATRPPGRAAGSLDGELEPLPGISLRIVGEAGESLPAGSIGEICVRGPTVMRGYFGLPDETIRAVQNGWLHTGDVGLLDEHGRLRVLDRRSDLIVTGGENVYPARVEAVLEAHAAVSEAGVVARPDDDYGQRPVAYLVARGEERPGDEALQRFCREQLAGYAVPVAFHWIDALPRTSAGKLLRRALPEAGPGASERG